MSRTPPRPEQPPAAPQAFRDALSELVQIGLTVARLVGRVAEGEHATALTARLRERLDSPDWENEFTNRPAEEVIAIICRDLGLDPVRMTIRSPFPHSINLPEMDGAVPLADGTGWQIHPPQRRPDG